MQCCVPERDILPFDPMLWMQCPLSEHHCHTVALCQRPRLVVTAPEF